MTRLVLGSASSGRRRVLTDAGVDPIVVVSGVDEDAIVDRLGPGATPAEVTTTLATAKAEQVAGRLDRATAADCVVVGCDSMLYIDGELRGKPQTVEAARRQWMSMAGRSGQLFTGHCLIRMRDGDVVSRNDGCSATTVSFGIPSEDDLDAYLRSGEPVTVAGGFTLDGLGGWFIDGIDGDPSSVIGIGLPLLRRLLAELDVSVAALWRSHA